MSYIPSIYTIDHDLSTSILNQDQAYLSLNMHFFIIGGSLICFDSIDILYQQYPFYYNEIHKLNYMPRSRKTVYLIIIPVNINNYR